MLTFNLKDELKGNEGYNELQMPMTNAQEKLPGYYEALRQESRARSTLT